MKVIFRLIEAKPNRKRTLQSIQAIKRVIMHREKDPSATEFGTRSLREYVAQLESTL